MTNYGLYITDSFDVIRLIKHNQITSMIKEDESDEIIFVIKNKTGDKEKIKMILHDRNDLLHIIRDEIEYHYPMQTFTTF